MDIIILPRPIKKSVNKQEAARQLWVENEEGMYKVYKKTEHTLQLTGPANKPFMCQFILIMGTLSLDYTSVRSANELVSQNEMCNTKFMDSNEIEENFTFGNDGKYYLKICGSCSRKPAKLCVRLHCNGLQFEKNIQFVSDSLVKSLRKNTKQSTAGKRTSDILPQSQSKRHKQNSHINYEYSLEDEPRDLILSSMQSNESPVIVNYTYKGATANITATTTTTNTNNNNNNSSAAAAVISQTNLFNPIFFRNYENSFLLRKHNIQVLHSKVLSMKTLVIQIQDIFTDAEEYFSRLQMLEYKLTEMYQLIETLEHEQPEQTLPFLVDRQDRLLKLSDNLFSAQDEISLIDKNISISLMPNESPDISPITQQPVQQQQQQQSSPIQHNVEMYVNSPNIYYNGYAPNYFV